MNKERRRWSVRDVFTVFAHTGWEYRQKQARLQPRKQPRTKKNARESANVGIPRCLLPGHIVAVFISGMTKGTGACAFHAFLLHQFFSIASPIVHDRSGRVLATLDLD